MYTHEGCCKWHCLKQCVQNRSVDMLLQQQRFGESYNSACHFTWFCHSPGYINTIKWKPKNDLL